MPPFSRLLDLAQGEVARTIAALPDALRPEAADLPVIYLPEPDESLLADGHDIDLLGLFVGEPRSERGLTPTPLPPQMYLFLDNIWDFSEGRRETFLTEVRTTFLHELGHYLGLDEADLEARGLE